MRPISHDPTFMSVQQAEEAMCIRRPAWAPWKGWTAPAPRHASAVRKAVKLEVRASEVPIRTLLRESAKKGQGHETN